MKFPEWLYKLLPGDQGSQQLGVIWRENSSTQAALTVSADVYVVPNDKCLVLTNAVVRAAPGAGQFSLRRRVMADPPAGTVRYDILDAEVNGGAGTQMSDNWSGEVVVPGGWKVKVEGQYDALGNPNNIGCEIHGYLIPRGSFVFG